MKVKVKFVILSILIGSVYFTCVDRVGASPADPRPFTLTPTRWDGVPS